MICFRDRPLIFFNIHSGIHLFSQLSPMCPNIRFTTSSHVTQLTYVKVLIFFHTNASSEPKEGWGEGGGGLLFPYFFIEGVASIPAKIA